MAAKPVSFKDLPGALRVGVILASGGGLLIVIWAVARELPLWVGGAIILGITAVGVLLLLYARLLKWRRACQARPMEQQVLRSTSTGQQSISDPEQLARVDDLRKRFEEGIATFRAAGKSLYSLPWYLILGEPGSGKTEAIRHCNVGFPPGLHDRYQGVGGTINMNWWFTDHGVIIDTAGRLMFEDAQSGGTREWKEFLGLLRKSRPNCPVNGALLVIPADSLIRDSAEEIERKASQIAQQFDMIQRTLDVRFPVYVVVTKSDLINGFREFFDKIVDPQLQHQILGWSNPGELDLPYDARLVDKYLEEIRTRLFRTRLTRLGELLCDESEDEEQPATAALYAFPYALEQLGPRLKRYLDLIFSVGSQWSCKPLFFRGIYFTSSMQEGAALDEDLATALGVPVESLPEGPVWRRDRAYFLRDLFVSKLFAERGLVTRATNAHKQYTRRRAAIMACAAASLIVLISLIVYHGILFRRSVGKLQNSLELATDETNPLQILHGSRFTGKYRYEGDRELGEGPLYEYFAELTKQALAWKQNKGIPPIFRPAVRWADINVKLQDAARTVYLTGVLEPLLQATSKKMAEQSNGVWTWDHNEPCALYQLIALRAQRAADPQSAAVLLDPLMQYIRPDDADHYPDHKKALIDPLRGLYGLPPHPSFDRTLLEEMDKAITNGAGLFKAYWSGSYGEHTELDAIREAVLCLADSNDIEGVKDANNLKSLERRLLSTYVAADPNTNLVEKWLTADFPRLQDVRQRVMHVKNSLDRCASLQQTWVLAADRRLEAVQSSYARLLEAFGAVTDANHLDPTLAATYRELRLACDQCTGSLADAAFRNRLGAIDNQFWANDLYDFRFSLCQIATDCLKELQEIRIEDVNGFPQTAEKVRELADKAKKNIQDRSRQNPKGHLVEETRQLASSLVTCGERRHYLAMVAWWLDHMPEDAAQLSRYVQQKSGIEYGVGTTASVFAAWKCVIEAGRTLPPTEDVSSELERRDREYKEYVNRYINQWLRIYGQDKPPERIPVAATWQERHKQLRSMANSPEKVLEALDGVRKELEACLKPVEDYSKDNETINEFRRLWSALRGDFYLPKCGRVLSNWRTLGPRPQDACRALLGCAADELLPAYFVSASCPPVASPDHYWYRLAVTSLDLLAREVEDDIKNELEILTGYQDKYPLNKHGGDNLACDDLARIHRFRERSLAAQYAPGTIGAGANTGNAEVDKLLTKLRGMARPPDWIGKTDVLPPPTSRYWCQIDEIKTSPTGRIRKVVILKGPKGSVESAGGRAGSAGVESVKWDDISHPKPVGSLSYDCSEDTVCVAFYAVPSDKNPLEKESSPTAWAWHRILEKHGSVQNDRTYLCEYVVPVSDEKVRIEMTLRFCRQEDCTDPTMDVFAPAR